MKIRRAEILTSSEIKTVMAGWKGQGKLIQQTRNVDNLDDRERAPMRFK